MTLVCQSGFATSQKEWLTKSAKEDTKNTKALVSFVLPSVSFVENQTVGQEKQPGPLSRG